MNHSSSIVFGLVSLVCCLQSVIFCLESCVCCLWSANGPSTTVEDSLQIGPFMQNKPNVKDAQINVNSYMKSKYEKLDTWLSGKNKPNSNPIKPNFRKAKMNVNSLITKDYRKKDDFAVQKNKPNPSGLRCLLRSCRTDQTQFQMRCRFFSASPLGDALRRSPWDCSLHNRLPRHGIYPERSRRGPRNDIFWSYPAKSGCPAWKNVGTMNLLAIESYRIYLNRSLLLSN